MTRRMQEIRKTSRQAAAGGTDASLASLSPVIRESLTSKAYQRIRMALMRSQLKPGERLVLRPLAAELGISPTPVREALLRLASEHALTIDHRGVACVPVFKPESYAEIRDLRIDLEGRAAVEALDALGRDELAELERINERFNAADENRDWRGALAANEAFHMRLYALAGKPVLLSLIENLWMRCGPFFNRLHWHDTAIYPNQHARILSALRARDAEAIREGVREDILAGWKRMTTDGGDPPQS
jgi:DNA-binding GntR family transcriptional regulator